MPAKWFPVGLSGVSDYWYALGDPIAEQRKTLVQLFTTLVISSMNLSILNYLQKPISRTYKIKRDNVCNTLSTYGSYSSSLAASDG